QEGGGFMSYAVVMALCLAGFGGLALASRRQQQEVFGRLLSARATLAWRCAGWLMLLLALVGLVRQSGWALGLVVFSGMTSLAASLVHGLLIVRDRLDSKPVRRG